MNTWLITGCSSGLGKSLTESVLEYGDQVIVTARRVEDIQIFKQKYPQKVLTLQLDVTKEEEVQAAIAKGIEQFGTIDVLVNNAGYCLRGAVEECSFEEVRMQFETNFFGTVRMIQHVLPHMRKQKKGTIVNFSSIAALSTSEGSAFYGASKCAVEGLSDGLRKEVNPLGIKVIVVEPGPFKTDFFYRSIAINEHNIEDYQHTSGKRKVKIKNLDDSVMQGWGDNTKAAKVIIKAVKSRESPFHLLLGSVAVRLAENIFASRTLEVAQWKELSIQTDVHSE
ncbi:oxidoreductase [Mailhella massiliensis]|uniref:oxidoreductase n=1 Tax=Mailhella massiliensis TaxID=1903261 RepID=UPI00097D52DF|nr:oxidoreductase [Mailhella massiliensis]